MRQRGRRSAAALAINVSGPSRLATPKGLNVKERAAFEQLVNSTSPEHFRSSDVPLLIALAQSIIKTHTLGRNSRKTGDWEKASRVMMALMTKARLTPQARMHARTADRMEPSTLRKPWDMRTKPWDREDDDDTQIQ